MNKIAYVFFVVFISVLVLFIYNSIFIVDETQQAIITQFGEPIGNAIQKAGLYFKVPFTQFVNYFDKRILNWDGDPNQIPTRDKRYIWVDTTARWRIVDPLKFMQSVGNEAGAYSRLDSIVDAATRDAISNLNLVEAIRDSNRLVTKPIKSLNVDEEAGVQDIALENISVGREQLTRDILTKANKSISGFGMELVDVRIKRITYIQEVLRKVFERMISERKRAAEQFRSVGQGKKAEIEGQVEKELQTIQSEAYRKAQEIKGEADAKAIKIYAVAYNNDPEFFSFVKTLDSYKKTVTPRTVLMLTTDSDYYGYFKKSIKDHLQP